MGRGIKQCNKTRCVFVNCPMFYFITVLIHKTSPSQHQQRIEIWIKIMLQSNECNIPNKIHFIKNSIKIKPPSDKNLRKV